jgi:hypothetical protein
MARPKHKPLKFRTPLQLEIEFAAPDQTAANAVSAWILAQIREQFDVRSAVPCTAVPVKEAGP